MKVVIDIDEKDYRDFQLQTVMLNPAEPSQRAKLAIANGKPLPKGHGRLKDGMKDTQVKFESAVAVWLTKWKGYIDDDIIARMRYRICDIARIAAHLEDRDDEDSD